MAISDNVIRVKRKILREMSEGTKTFTEEVQGKAVNAILHGLDPKGPADNPCEVYMRLFADTTQELERLTGKDGTTVKTTGNNQHAGKDRARAYLMSAGPCGPDTVLTFEKTVTLELNLP